MCGMLMSSPLHQHFLELSFRVAALGGKETDVRNCCCGGGCGDVILVYLHRLPRVQEQPYGSEDDQNGWQPASHIMP